MSPQKEQTIAIQTSEISKFYQGKSLFITGAGGFLGVVLLEALLRCCPGIRRIYILLRSKKGVQPEDRKELIFKKEIFYKLKEKNPDALNKVVVVSGDVAQENLGLCEDDLTKVTEEVSVVFHCAACISFLKSICFMIQQNVIGTHNIIALCRKLKKLDVLVYTSTAYSNCNRKCIEEKVYEMPFSSGKVLELAKYGNEKELNCLFNKCSPRFPNSYTFSKCVSENLISETATDLPISIVRPSIIICCLKGALPGFIEYGSGIVSITVGIGKGFIRVMRIDEEKITDQVPADTVANTHIVAACYQVSERLPSPSIYNCTSGELAPITWRQFSKGLMDLAVKNPLPKSYQRPGLTICTNPLKYWFFAVFEHYIPAIVIDILLWITGHKLRLLKLYQLYEKSRKVLEPFSLNEWKFRCENFKSLSGKLNDIDTEMFPVDLKGFNIEEIAKCLLVGSPMYSFRKDGKPMEKKSHLTDLRLHVTSFLKWFILGLIVSVFYIAFFKTSNEYTSSYV